MGAFLRSIFGVIIGLFVAILIISLVDYLSHVLFPLPAGVNPTDADQLRAAVGQIPVTAFLLMILGWGVGSFLGAWLAGRIAGRNPLIHGLVVTVILMITGIANMIMLPHPIWVWALGILAFLGCGYLGAKLSARTRAFTAQPVLNS